MRDAVTRLRDKFMPLAREGDHAAAIAAIDDTLKQSPRDAELQYEAGMYYQKRAQRRLSMPDADLQEVDDLRAHAVHHFKTASDLEPRRYIYAFRTGANMRRLGDDAGVEYLRRALSIERDNPFVWTELGIVYQNRNMPDEALGCFLNAAHFNPNDDMVNRRINELGGYPGMPHKVNYALAGPGAPSPAI